MQDLELVDISTEQATAVRQDLKTNAHKHGWLHKTAIGYLRCGDDWALVRQAADRQDAGRNSPQEFGDAFYFNLEKILSRIFISELAKPLG